MMLLMNSTSSGPLELLMRNSSSLLTEDPAAAPKDSFSNALTKNIMAMLVWLALSIINISMVHTFLRHSLFYENPRYIMFICMVVNDALQLTFVTALYVVSYIFRKILASVCCPLKKDIKTFQEAFDTCALVHEGLLKCLDVFLLRRNNNNSNNNDDDDDDDNSFVTL